MESIRDVVQRLGGADLVNQFQDDTALLQHLLLAQQQNKQLQPLARYGEQVVGQWDKVQGFLNQQQAQQQAAAGDPWYKQWFNPPQFDPSWEKQILKDSSGNLHAAPGAPPDVVQRYAQYQQYQRAQIEKMTANPFEYFAPAIKALARQEAQSIAQEQLATHTDRQFANDFIQQNANWLYAAGPDGRAAVDPMSGQPLLSQWGTMFRDHAKAANDMGIRDVRAQQQYALERVQFAAMVQERQAAQSPVQQPAYVGGVQQPVQSPATVARQQANQVFLNGAGGRQQPNVGPQGQAGNPPANQAGLSLKERLNAAFAANGVTAQDIAVGR